MLSEEQKLPYTGFSNKKLKSPDIRELKSPSRKLREEVKSQHQLKRIQGFFEQEKKAEEQEKLKKKVKDQLNKHETNMFYKRFDAKIARQERV